MMFIRSSLNECLKLTHEHYHNVVKVYSKSIGLDVVFVFVCACEIIIFRGKFLGHFHK